MSLVTSSSVVIDRPGSYLQKSGNRFVVKSRDAKKEYSADKICQIIIGAPSAISSDAVRLAIEKNIDLVYTDFRGDPYARIYRTSLGGTTLTRKKQLEATFSPLGLKIVTAIVSAKVKSQMNYLKSLSKDRKGDVKLRELSLYKPSDVSRFFSRGESMDQVRQKLLGFEGSTASIYFQGLGLITGYKKRDPQANDEFNICLNYAYGMLYAEVERSCILAGLDPYLGYYHTDRYGKPCLVLDMIELFRVAVADRAVVTLFTRKEVNNKDFDKRGTLTLSSQGKRKVIESVIKRLNTQINYNGKKTTLKNVILNQSRELAAYLLGHKRDFKAFVYR